MINKLSQKKKALQLYQLHHVGTPLLLPNIWDVLGAKLLEDIGYPAIATASASIAYTNGYADGEKIPFGNLLILLKKIVSSVNIPVTADIESGYCDNNDQLQKNIKQLLETGIVGINIEDTNLKTANLYSTDAQCERIKLIRAISDEMEIPLFINTRTDVLLYYKDFPTPESIYNELLKRGLAYKEAGANCFFPIGLSHKEAIQTLITQLKIPINILTYPGIPDLESLKKIGVARISLGPSFLKIAIKALKTFASELKELRGLSEITENEITSDYLKSLVKV